MVAYPAVIPAPRPRLLPRFAHLVRSVAPRSRIETAIRTARSSGFGTATGSLKNTIIPSPVNRSKVPSYFRITGPTSAWYSHRTSMTSSGSLVCKGREAPKIDEYDTDLTTVALKGILRTTRDDEFGEVSGEKAFQPLEALKLPDLFLHARFQRFVPL